MTDSLIGFFTPWLIALVVLILQVALPARRFKGYARDDVTGEPLEYRLNGLLVFIITLGLWYVAGLTNLMPFDWLWSHLFIGLAGATTLAVVASLALVFFRTTATAFHHPIVDYYLGRRANPRMFRGRIDVKMSLYVVGAVLLELNLLSWGAHHYFTFPGDGSIGISLYLLLFTWFITDYFVFEHVHLYTYDLIAEKLGFKLIWGCLVVYAYFYGVSLWVVAELPDPQAPVWLYAIAIAVFFVGWTIARGANMQKYIFKLNPKRKFLGFIAPRTIGNEEHQLLASGFWGSARHINYLGEILMATGLTLSLGWPSELLTWLYPLFYVVFLGTRERMDDKRCAAKYDEIWLQYRRTVPKRIVPGVY